jgi:hypothetical protein
MTRPYTEEQVFDLELCTETDGAPAVIGSGHGAWMTDGRGHAGGHPVRRDDRTARGDARGGRMMDMIVGTMLFVTLLSAMIMWLPTD